MSTTFMQTSYFLFPPPKERAVIIIKCVNARGYLHPILPLDLSVVIQGVAISLGRDRGVPILFLAYLSLLTELLGKTVSQNKVHSIGKL